MMSCDCKGLSMAERQVMVDKVAMVPAPSNFELNWKEFLCGGMSSFCNILISYPLNKLIYRQMMQGVEATFALRQIRKEGLGFLYRGMLPPLLQRSMSMSVMFGVYDNCLRRLLDYNLDPYTAKCFAGVIAGCCEATLIPFERIQTLLIHPKYHSKFRNTADAARYIATHYGIKEFYRGHQPILIRNGPSNAMFFILRDEIQERLPQQDNVFYHSLQNFLSGASIGAALSTLYYPLNVIKFKMQCELGGPHRTIRHVFYYILRKRDFRYSNFYHGVGLNISRAFLSWGIINSSYEMCRKCLYS